MPLSRSPSVSTRNRLIAPCARPANRRDRAVAGWPSRRVRHGRALEPHADPSICRLAQRPFAYFTSVRLPIGPLPASHEPRRAGAQPLLNPALEGKTPLERLDESWSVLRFKVDLTLHWLHRRLLRRSAIRVCQPGPVALHCSMTSTGRRIEMSFRGLSDRGRPPLFTTALDSACSDSSGSSLYS